MGDDSLFSGNWWITIFPGAAQVPMVLAIDLLGDGLREAFDPKLRQSQARGAPDDAFLPSKGP